MERVQETMSHNGVTYSKELREKVNRLGKDAQEIGELAKSFAKDSLDAVKAAGFNQASHLEEELKNKAEAVENKIKDAPLKSLLIGVGAGMIIGALARKMRS